MSQPWTAPYSETEQDKFGLRPVTDGGMAFCGVSEEHFAINGVTHQWPRSIRKILWSVTFSRLGSLSDMDFKDAATVWLKEISDACDRVYEYTSNPGVANLLYTRERLDGPSGVLADMRIPMGNVTPNTQLQGRFDDSEGWVLADKPKQGEIDVYRTGLHETLHFEGLGHAPFNLNQAAIIAPMYSLAIRHLQPADIAELVRRRGLPVVPPAPTPTPTNPSLGKPITVHHKTEQDGKEWSGTFVVPRTK